MDVSAKARPRVSFFWVLFFVALVVASVITIWSFSLEGGRASTLTSERVLRFIEKNFGKISFVDRILGLSELNRSAVLANFRKIAHFVEYAALGFLTQCLLAAMRRMNGHNMLHCVSFGLLVALIDESIQIGLDRGPALADVWLDLVGLLFGCIIVWTLYGIGAMFRRNNGIR